MRPIALLLLTLLAACSTAPQPVRPPAVGETPAQAIAKERQLVVGYADEANLQAIAARLDARVAATIPQIKAALLELPAGAKQDIAARKAFGLARYAEPNGFERKLIPAPQKGGVGAQDNTPPPAATSFNDPLIPSQWWIGKIAAPDAWATATGRGVTIGIVDSAFDRSHPDLCDQPARTRCTAGFDAATGMPFPVDAPFVGNPALDSHGSGSAGMAAALSNNGLLVAGPAGGSGDPASAARLMSIANFKNGRYTTDFGTAQGLVWATDNGADILNNSWGGGGYSFLLKDAFDYALANGVMVVASAGNDYRDQYNLPKGFPGLVSVAATNPYDNKADFSTFGAKVAISAPGDDTLTTYYNNTATGGTGVQLFGGTSAASPALAGSAALVLQTLREGGFDPTPYQILKILQATADPVTNPTNGKQNWEGGLGAGRVNVGKAVQKAKTLAELPADGGYLELYVGNRGWANDPVPLSAVTLVLRSDPNRQYYTLTDLSGVAKFYGIEPGAYDVYLGGPSTLFLGGTQDPATGAVNVPSGSVQTPTLGALNQQADAYELVLAKEGGQDVLKRNNARATATDLSGAGSALAAGIRLGAAFDSEGFFELSGGADPDYYSLPLTTGQTLTLVGIGLGIESKARVKLSVVRADGTVAATSSERTTPSYAPASLTFAAPADGTYYVLAEEATGAKGLFYFYQLRVRVQ